MERLGNNTSCKLNDIFCLSLMHNRYTQYLYHLVCNSQSIRRSIENIIKVEIFSTFRYNTQRFSLYLKKSFFCKKMLNTCIYEYALLFIDGTIYIHNMFSHYMETYYY